MAGENTSTANTANSGGAKVKKGHASWFIIIVGLGFLAMFLVGVVTDVETNEAYILNQGQVNIFKPDWSVLMQIPSLVAGNDMSAADAEADFVGWGTELIYLGFIIGYELMHTHVHTASGELMGKIFRVCAILIVLFNIWTNSHYGSLGSGTGGHIAFAAVLTFVVGFFGTLGMFFIRHGWNNA